VDRPLVKPEHFERFAGHEVAIRLTVPRDGRRRFSGRLLGLAGKEVAIETEQGKFSFALHEIERAQLVPNFASGRDR